MTKSEAKKIDQYSFHKVYSIFTGIEWNDLFEIAEQIEAIQKGWAD